MEHTDDDPHHPHTSRSHTSLSVVDPHESGGTDPPLADGHAIVSSEGPGVGPHRAVAIDPQSFGELGPDGERPASDQALEMPDGYDATVLGLDRNELRPGRGCCRELDVGYARRRGSGCEASAGLEAREVVLGPDDRMQVAHTRGFPWRTICSLRIRARDGSQWIGTGWLVGRRTVITAGHCVFVHGHGGWAREIEVIPGRDGQQRPFGAVVATTFRSVKGWIATEHDDFDYGAILLPATDPVGDRLGHLGFGHYDDADLGGVVVNLAGHPGDKETGTQWWHARRLQAVGQHRLVYNIDTAGGQSGAPVWRLHGDERTVVGIHTSGASSGNSATRITQEVFDNIATWKAEGR